MQKKLTITIDEKVYDRLYTVIGRRRISRFIEDLVCPHVSNPSRSGNRIQTDGTGRGT